MHLGVTHQNAFQETFATRSASERYFSGVPMPTALEILHGKML